MCDPAFELFIRKSYQHSALRRVRVSYYFSIKWLTPFYPANSSRAAGSGEKCTDLRFFAATPQAAETAAE